MRFKGRNEVTILETIVSKKVSETVINMWLDNIEVKFLNSK
ncbi:hypothetical protein [Clostridium muellerianum]|nr:hypothetical protein [Clostridium muellerianum]